MKNKTMFVSLAMLMLLAIIAQIMPANTQPQKERQSSIIIGENTEIGSVNWTLVWQKLNNHLQWDLEWYDGDSWESMKSDLMIARDYPTDNTSKITLIFNASKAGDYRLTFAVDLIVKNYTERLDKYQYQITYDNYTITFDWSDVMSIPGLEITHGVKDNLFWFRMRRDNVPQGAHIEIDPEIIIDSQTVGATGFTITILHPSTVVAYSARGQTFTTPNDYYFITKASFKLIKIGSPTAIMVAALYEITGTYGSTSIPTGTALATSDGLDSSTLTGSFLWYNLTFTGANMYLMEPNHYYAIALQAQSGFITSSNYVVVAHTDPVHSGNMISYYNNAWRFHVEKDTAFIVYGHLPITPNIMFNNSTTTSPKSGEPVLHAVNWTGDTADFINYTFSYNVGAGWVNDTEVAFGGNTWSNVTKSWDLPIGTVVSWKMYAEDGYSEVGTGADSYEIHPQYGLISGYAQILPMLGAGIAMVMVFFIGVVAINAKRGGIPIQLIILPLTFMLALLLLYFYFYYISRFVGI